jgi:hypothetical protein
MNILVIHEYDYNDKETDVIGVANSISKAEEIINNYYGSPKEIKKTDIRDSTLEYSKILEVLDHKNEPYKVKITLEWFELNDI